ncbi:MAG: PQQ-dependent sugar dehydrogenase [Acidimicrobiales bacterium]
MRPSRARLVAPGVALMALVIVGACSDDGGTATTPDSTLSTTTLAPTTTTTTATSTAGGTAGATTTPAPTTPPTTAPPPPPTPLEAINLELRRVATMNSPIAMATRAGRREIWVAERAGRVRVFNPANNAVSEPIVDISNTVSNGGERGLLGLAFSPDGAKLYLSYTNPQGNSRVDEFTMNGDSVNTGSRRTVLAIQQPFANHNGGNIVFGPDGYLWLGYGDGGSQGDPNNNGQNVNVLLGSILRIDPSSRTNGEYGIPADNPFAAGGGLPEIWIKGTRNPWRFSFDRATGDLWIADVGGSVREEIDVLTTAQGRGRGANLEWSQYEGNQRLKGDRPAGGTAPVYEYSHAGGNCSITGGFVYRGNALPALQGVYIYGDYCVSKIQLFRLAGASGQNRDTGITVEGGGLGSFGEGPDGELYVLSLDGGVFHIEGA